MPNANKTYDLKVEKTIAKPAAEVFRALGEGRLFMNCGAEQDLSIDFKVGGKYSIEFKNYGMKNQGAFLEIVPNQKIVFTWCQDFETNPTPDTEVVVELKEVAGGTAVTIIHSGFVDAENRDGHNGGWTGGLTGLGEEMVGGKLHMVRKIPVSIEKLHEICKTNSKGEVTENTDRKLVANRKDGTKVTFLLDTDDDSKDDSWLELIHEGLATEAQQKNQRKEWAAQIKSFT